AAQAYFDLRYHVKKQGLLTVNRAASIINSIFPEFSHESHRNQLAVPLPRKEIPTYIMQNAKVQPWALLPTKAAAYAQYPNFFRSSSLFFGSLNREIVNRRPYSLLPADKLSMDLAQVCTNLGILNGWDIVQKREKLKDLDFVWPANELPRDHHEVKLFKHLHLRLALKWEQHKPLWEDGSMVKDQREYRDQQQVQQQQPLPHLPLAPLFGPLPLTVRNLSKASQPVLLYPLQLRELAQRMPSGLFLLYHHELGVITDAQAFLFDVPVVALAHVGLPVSMAAAVNGAVNRTFRAELGKPLREVTKLKDWSLSATIAAQVRERRQQLLERAEQTKRERKQIQDLVTVRVGKFKAEVDKEDSSLALQDELLAWQLKE
uniref:uS8m n=1 Tax=Polytomella magna TaxID=353565 RepID=UPI002240E3E0|nr:Chain Bh, uS8m [Polytomella magna]8APN_Bh Chain Bh, uS8m [Polytomella magna]8APO_Bh Chain Bh, uS8m [Polytomella magna]